jgi:hypothetical protein
VYLAATLLGRLLRKYVGHLHLDSSQKQEQDSRQILYRFVLGIHLDGSRGLCAGTYGTYGSFDVVRCIEIAEI